MLEKMQEIAFQMIATVGGAKSLYMEAIYLSRESKFEEAATKLDEGAALFSEAHSLHFELLQKEAIGEELPFSLLLMHAEDQMLTTEVIQLMAVEIIELRKERNA